jgi:sulfur relay (sulfurtransferase) DsrF/TusC family protein
MSVGLTLADNAVRVVFVDDGVYLLGITKPEAIGSPEIKKHIETLLILGHELFADKESLDERRLESVAYKVAIRPRSEIVEIISQSDVVITY